MPDLNAKDQEINRLIKNRTLKNKDYWSFRYNSCDEHARAFMQYPAMMVPLMQRELIDVLISVSPEIKSIYDPFMGSGTIILEAMLKNKEFKGRDINPLALLICKVKKGPFFPKALAEKKDALYRRIAADRNKSKDIDFPRIDKWFRNDVQVSLSKIRRAIQLEKSKWCRRFFWVALAETVRLASNSRTSTFKLHIRPENEVVYREIHPIELFQKITNDNFVKYLKVYEILFDKGFLSKGRYKKRIELLHGDSTLQSYSSNGKHDLIVTSPPYGDNATTVTYGQFSYLPLKWIDIEDIDSSIDVSLLNSTHKIDSESLGGSKVNALDYVPILSERSKTFRQYNKSLRKHPLDRIKRLSAFYRDFDKSLDSILADSGLNSYMIWTVGNRSVGNKKIRMDKILTELLEFKNVYNIATIKRRIPSKRMAIRNCISSTMRDEAILIFRRGGA